MLTPDFPIWAGGFAAQYRRLRTTTGTHLHQLEAIFGASVARYILAQREHEAFSRDRGWNLRLVFWTFLWQVAQPGSACREAIRQAQSACRLLGRKVPPDQNSPYCTARARLPMEALEEIHRAVTGEAERAVASKDLWLGLCVRVVDASTVIAPDTAANQKAYPQSRKQRPGCGFPLIHVIGLFAWRRVFSWLGPPAPNMSRNWSSFSHSGNICVPEICCWATAALRPGARWPNAASVVFTASFASAGDCARIGGAASA